MLTSIRKRNAIPRLAAASIFVRSSSFGRNSRAASSPSRRVAAAEVQPSGSNAPAMPTAAEPRNWSRRIELQI